MKPSWKWFFAGLCVLAVHVDGIARDGLTLELLTGNHSDVVRVIMPLPITSEFSLLPRTDLRLAVETSLAYWRQRRPAEDPSRSDAPDPMARRECRRLVWSSRHRRALVIAALRQ